ncbi:hypothetical protein, partial [Streptomyces sp. NRRL B-24720]|uniref:hypothetical protein n=1 Tax=Streptomyces sp. NRRL B-24720 TaxID=1476876 RepID=UPI001F18AD9D
FRVRFPVEAAPCRAGEFLLRFPVLRFRVSLSGGSNLTRLIFVPFTGSNLIPMAVEVAFAFRRVHYFSRFPWRLIIESMGSNFGMPKSHPPG